MPWQLLGTVIKLRNSVGRMSRSFERRHSIFQNTLGHPYRAYALHVKRMVSHASSFLLIAAVCGSNHVCYAISLFALPSCYGTLTRQEKPQSCRLDHQLCCDGLGIFNVTAEAVTPLAEPIRTTCSPTNANTDLEVIFKGGNAVPSVYICPNDPWRQTSS